MDLFSRVFILPFFSLLFVLTPLAAAAHADEAGTHAHLRTLDNSLQELLDTGIRDSPSFRALVDRINASDVVVYLRCSRRLRTGLSGQMTFMGASAGLRYVVVALDPEGILERRVATLGHELRHVVEVADTPAIIDSRSLGVAYTRMGRSGWLGLGLVFDTVAAIDTGVQIWREVVAGSGRRAE